MDKRSDTSTRDNWLEPLWPDGNGRADMLRPRRNGARRWAAKDALRRTRTIAFQSPIPPASPAGIERLSLVPDYGASQTLHSFLLGPSEPRKPLPKQRPGEKQG